MKQIQVVVTVELEPGTAGLQVRCMLKAEAATTDLRVQNCTYDS